MPLATDEVSAVHRTSRLPRNIHASSLELGFSQFPNGRTNIHEDLRPSPAPPVHLAPHPGVVICSIFVSFILMLTLLLSLKYNMADCHLTGGSIKIAARVHGRVQSNSPPQAHKLLLYKSQFTIVCRHLLLPSHPSLSPATIISLSLWCRTP